MQARNAHFNLNRLGVTVDTFGDNFYGTDYNADPAQSIDKRPGLQSDRLFGDWHLTSPRVEALSRGDMFKTNAKPVAAIGIPDQWSLLIRSNVEKARAEQQRVRTEFKVAFKNGLVCAGFERGEEQSSYLLFERNEV
jgi:predicted GNAT superfamily acetyltransferase